MSGADSGTLSTSLVQEIQVVCLVNLSSSTLYRILIGIHAEVYSCDRVLGPPLWFYL